MATRKNDISIPLGKFLAWSIPILIALVEGTFGLTRYISAENRDALETKLHL